MDRTHPDALARALEHADLRVLLMVLFHQTGDRRWLEPPFRPARDVRLIADEGAGLPPEIQGEIRRAALEILAEPKADPAIEDPGNERMCEMMAACLGENVPEEYAGMMREELGFTSRDVTWPGETPPEARTARRVLIIGAGVSGIALGARLEHLGIPYTVVERNREVGGTWYENRYPGCGVDTPNHAYSFSMGERYPWERYFSPQPQLLDYLVRSADAFGVRPRIRFETALTGARWNEAAAAWDVTLTTPDGETRERFEFLVSAIGQFGEPTRPEIEGANRFTGPSFHSAEWPEGLAVDGRHVTLIGNGASAMQIAPTIADRVASLTIYQRSPQWARPIPRYHDPIPEGAQWLLQSLPFYAAWFRFTMMWRYGDGLLRFLRKDPAWPHPDRSLNRVNERHRVEMVEHIEAKLADRPDLLEACLPSYPPYGKRILLDNGWYDTIQRRNVALVTTPVEAIEADGVRTADGRRRPADILVWATGFRMTQMTSRLGLVGQEGTELAEAWGQDDPSAYLGVTVPRFPNLFLMLGPNTGLGHGGSSIFQSECQARYITSLLVQMISDDIASAAVRPRSTTPTTPGWTRNTKR